MTFSRTKTAAGAAFGTLLLTPTVTPPVRAEPVPRFTQPDLQSVGSVIPTRPAWTNPDPRPAAVEHEHRRAQRIIDRVCARC